MSPRFLTGAHPDRFSGTDAKAVKETAYSKMRAAAQVFGRSAEDHLDIGLLIQIGLAFCLIYVYGARFFNITDVIAAPLIGALAIGVSAFYFRIRPSITAVAVLTILLCALVSIVFGALLIDGSWDGMVYHSPAAILIAQNWNPTTSQSHNIWMDSYPNGVWTIAAIIYGYSHTLSGTLFYGLCSLAGAIHLSGFLAKAVLKTGRMGRMWLLLACFNPVFLAEFSTSMVDGILALQLTTLVATIAVFLSEEAARGRLLKLNILAISTIICCVSTKTTGLFFPFVVVAGWMAASLFGKPPMWRNIYFGLLFIFAMCCSMALQWRPWITNLIDHGQLLYPDSASILKNQIPPNLSDANIWTHMVYLFFGATQNTADHPATLTFFGLPRPVDVARISFASRLGGFGPFFGLQALLCATCFGLGFFLRRRASPVLSMGIISLAVSLLFPISWWARYVPLAWVGVAYLMAASCAERKTRYDPLYWIAGGLAAANIMAAFLFPLTRTVIFTHNLTAAVKRARQAPALVFKYRDPPGANVAYADLFNRLGLKLEAGPCGTPLLSAYLEGPSPLIALCARGSSEASPDRYAGVAIGDH